MLADSTADVPDTRIPRHLTQAGDAPTSLASSNRRVWLMAVAGLAVGDRPAAERSIAQQLVCPTINQ